MKQNETREKIFEKLKAKNRIEREKSSNKNGLKIIISSNNSHKIKEYKEIFSAYPNIRILSLKDANINIDPEENGTTFKENSLIKAKSIAKLTTDIVIADDSGLEIDALDGFPGIFSARFMSGHTYEEKFMAIFDMLKDKENRGAQFHCVITLVNLIDEPLFFEGIVRGEIAKTSNGSNGFGYDPIFIPNGYNTSFANLSDDEKNTISHRGIASKKLLNFLKENNYI
ncbi:MAG: RdgB/HAM1 family non-canonical purine NTP pyrophosphatase [Erysipelotrichales bacterium]|nr:RdgB/HAM1 family non-canonical purine NTP pyrophosphatase [Erysipelotrichales bacterium]